MVETFGEEVLPARTLMLIVERLTFGRCKVRFRDPGQAPSADGVMLPAGRSAFHGLAGFLESILPGSLHTTIGIVGRKGQA